MQQAEKDTLLAFASQQNSALLALINGFTVDQVAVNDLQAQINQLSTQISDQQSQISAQADQIHQLQISQASLQSKIDMAKTALA